MNMDQNTILIAGSVTAVALTAFYHYKKDLDQEAKVDEINVYSIPYLCENIKTQINENVNQNLTSLYISKTEMEKRKENKKRLTKAVRSCAQGDPGEKAFMLSYVKDLLQSKLNINEETIDFVIPFDQPDMLTGQDKYDILMQIYIKKDGFEAFGNLNKLCKFEEDKLNNYGVYYEVDKDDISRYYREFSIHLNYVLKLAVVTQRVFQEVYGLGVVDELIYQKSIDGISAGNSGLTYEQYNYMEEIMQTSDITVPKSYESVWIILHGKPIHFSFLSFRSKAELIRVCTNLYLYDNVGHLNSSNGYKLSYLRNGSRVVVTRPKLTSGWAFFVRKFDSVKALDINKLIIDKNYSIVKETVIWMVKGMLNIIISGDQGSGKTTFLKCIFQFMDQRFEIRTTEAEFELWLNVLYPNLSTVAFRSTDEVSIIDAINIEKKTNGVIMVLGEIVDTIQANAYISLTQSGTKCTYGTIHTITEEDLIDYFRSALLSKNGNFTNEMAAEEQAANGINIDIHWEKTGDGHRYISYITEIIPYPRRNVNTDDSMEKIAESLQMLSRRRAFETREIITFENGEYIIKNSFSERAVKKIIKNLSMEDREKFLTFNKKIEEYIESSERSE
jgi:pilus assembly protein CpaF